ncbi:glycosyltransferase involved in cell wall biosynthesis [Kitasatospora sp. MAP12-15]|uniref:glycosyltransferase n=1 Tax=unclassified Kitasatospora TaxID=2633591 RepID=UPI0024767FE9|nr:glycosyltransferase [Kitasatospora sp. MAP12-44]MDH6115456.1 glycosyltransferase involved in cell wall biosynthesis [Kitasatospora sp. MAP12-44]
MRLHVHDYTAVNLSGILDGAVLMHQQMAQLLSARADVVLHDQTAGRDCLANVGDGDVVYAGNGPYAHLYHLWREQHGTDFRIVREVHTTFWSGYWTQEELCAPLTRPGDVVLFPSEFTRQVFLREFPGTGPGNSAVAYPMLARIPHAAQAPVPPPGAPLRIGYLGALSEAKNFDQVLGVFQRYHRESGGRAELVFAGKPNHPRWETGTILARLASEGVPSEAVTPLGLLHPSELTDFLSRIDVLLFPSTASRESLGRVVVEALAHGIPVLAADMGPAVELLPARNLVPTTLHTETVFGMDRIGPLGVVDEDVLVARLLERDYEPARLPDSTAPFEDETLWRAMAGELPSARLRHDSATVGRVRVRRRPGGGHERLLAETEQVFLEYFQRRDQALLARIAASEHATGLPRPELRAIATRPGRSLADYRALPALVDALAVPPLTYSLDSGPSGR